MRPVLRFRQLPLWVLWLVVGFGCASQKVSAGEFELISKSLRLEPGMRVADVGAGDGEWSVEIARVVGEQGHVWATEVDADDFEKIEQRVREGALSNVTPLLGGSKETGLPPGCCDAVLLRLVYHHFTEPESMRKSLIESLRPDGLLVIIEILPKNSWPELDDVPDRGGHGIDPEELQSELTNVGFEFLERHDDWNGDRLRYCSVFRRRP